MVFFSRRIKVLRAQNIVDFLLTKNTLIHNGSLCNGGNSAK